MKVILFRDLPTERWWSMERYADELLRALREIGCDVQPYVVARPLPQLRGSPDAFANYAWRSIIYPLAASAHQGDVNHIIDHSYAHLIHGLDPCRTIVTCHDIAPLALNEGRGFSRRLWDQSFRAMLCAAHIITDSAFTRSEIMRFTSFPAERITVVPLAVGNTFFEPVAQAEVDALRKRYDLSNRHIILHVGSCAPRKNIELVLHALNDLRDLDAMFVQVGGQFTQTQVDLVKSLGIDVCVVQTPLASEYSLRVWYQAANVFVFPSLYEGFGMPVIEAMASGTPVVCANASSLPEVVGNAAILIDPHEPAKLGEAIRSVLIDSTRAAGLGRHGRAHAKLFTWEQCARQTLKVYGQVAECRPKEADSRC